jgi:hypothetical protein
MLAEKSKMENQMKGKYSLPRLRWIKAIKRVLVQNYVEKVRKRLGMESEDGEEDASVDKFDATSSKKTLLHHGIPSSMSMDGAESVSADSTDEPSLHSISFDHASLHSHDLPNIKNARKRRNKSHHHHHKISFLHQDSLPTIDMQGPVKQIFQTAPLAPSKSLSSIQQQRRSLDNSHFASSAATATYENLLPTIPVHDEYGEGRVPSLLESYHNISQRIQISSSVPMLANSRSIRTVRLTIS